MRRALRRHRRIVGQPKGARFHRDASAGGCVGTIGHTVLAGAARRHGEPQRGADALADRERTVPAQRIGLESARNAGVGRGAFPGSRGTARTLDHRS